MKLIKWFMKFFQENRTPREGERAFYYSEEQRIYNGFHYYNGFKYTEIMPVSMKSRYKDAVLLFIDTFECDKWSIGEGPIISRDYPFDTGGM